MHDLSPTQGPAQARPGRSARWLAAILVGFVLLAGAYSVIVPPFETPDEIWHFAYIQYVASGHGLPVATQNTPELWRQQGIQAPGYYVVAAALTQWIDQGDFPALYRRINPHGAIGFPDAPANRNFFIHHKDEGWPWQGSVLALHIARLFSVLLGALTVYAVYRTLRLVVGESWALLGAAALAVVPQFVFLSSAASNDNATNATAALVLWRAVALVSLPVAAPRPIRWPPDRGGANASPAAPGGGGQVRAPVADGKMKKGGASGPDRRLRVSSLALGACLGLALLSKLNAVGLIGVAGLAVLLAAWQRRSPDLSRPLCSLHTWQGLVEPALLAGLPALAIAGWWYVRNWLLYGNVLAWNMWRANVLLRVNPAGWRTIVAELGSLEWSSWGLFGWVNVGYPAWVYTGFRILEVVLAAGLVLGVVRWLARRGRVEAWPGKLLVLVWLALLIVSWLRFTREAPAAQGRYLLPAAPAWALLMALGLRGWRPPRGLPWLNGLALGGLALAAAAAPVWVLRPAYHVPAEAQLPANAVHLQADLGGQFAVTALAAEPGPVEPGQARRVTVAWQAEKPSPTDYSVFVHLVDEAGFILAQADTMPGGGLLPTSQWRPGQTRVEAYQVIVPAAVRAPNQAHWVVGLYDHETGQRLPVAFSDGQERGQVTLAEGGGLRFGSVAVTANPSALPNPVAAEFVDNVTLAGYDLSSYELRPGQPVTVTLYWQARGPVGRSYVTFVHLLDDKFDTFGGSDGRPRVPAQQWQTAGLVADEHTFKVAADAHPGLYQIEIGLYPPGTSNRLLLAHAPGAEGADRVLSAPVRVSGN